MDEAVAVGKRTAAGVRLRLHGVVRGYGKVRALDGVSFDVRAGELVALMGPNGAGKTTLFQILAGLLAPDAGAVAVLGRDIARDRVRYLSGLGLVFQAPTQARWLAGAGVACRRAPAV